MRRALLAESPNMDDDVDLGVGPLSMSSTESCALAGIAIASSSSSDAVSPEEEKEKETDRAMHPEKAHLYHSSGVVVPGCAVPAASSPSKGANAAAATAVNTSGIARGSFCAVAIAKPIKDKDGTGGKQKVRQLSLMQFFKPVAAAVKAAVTNSN